jgi:hypothetical protein
MDNKFQIVFENDEAKIDKKICLGILCANREPEDKDERFHFHLALNFFKNNFSSFDEKEIKEVCSNEYSAKRLGGNFDLTVLEICVKKGEPLPIVLPSWKDKKIKNKVLKSYITLVHEKGDVEQLAFFLEHFHNPMMDFIEENKNNISASLYEAISSKVFNQKIQKENLEPLIDILVNRDFSILHYLEKNHTENFKELIKTPLNDSNKNVTVNLGQYILLNRKYNSLGSVNKIFANHKDVLLEPINIRVCLYDKKISIFDYGLTNSKFMAFAPFSLNDELNEEYKEQITAAAFYLFQNKNDPSLLATITGFKNIWQNWYPSIMENATDEQFFSYSKKIIEGTNNHAFKKELESITLHRKLHNDLSINQVQNKKLKI